ncbi:MAG TPA: hypothetical protein VF100_08065 [Thermoanaerobaculia bacterium]
MRKLFAALALVFAFAFALGTFAPGTADAAGGGGLGGNCYYTCSCSGAPLYCCKTSTGSVSCKPTDVIQCPQVYNC